jgi:GT2 family glycosyltransferase
LPDEYGLVVGRCSLIDEQGVQVPGRRAAPWLLSLLQWYMMTVKNWIPAPAVMIRKSALDDVGLFDENLAFEDYDLWLRILRTYRLYLVGDYVTQYRIYPDSQRPISYEFVRSAQSVRLKWMGKWLWVDVIMATQIFSLARKIQLTNRPEKFLAHANALTRLFLPNSRLMSTLIRTLVRLLFRTSVLRRKIQEPLSDA